jgi:hypothetical protein
MHKSIDDLPSVSHSERREIQMKSYSAWWWVCLLVLLSVVGAQGQKVKVEYNTSVDFSKFKAR